MLSKTALPCGRSRLSSVHSPTHLLLLLPRRGNDPSSARQARGLSQMTDSKDRGKSIFDSDESAWDHVFKDLDTASKDLLATPVPERRRKPPRRQQMTALEMSAFGEMFDMVFHAVSDGNGMPSASSSNQVSTIGVGRRHSAEVSDLALHLRHRSRTAKWTSEADEELDRKKEEMDLCNTDRELLEWAVREVFGDSQRYEKQARSSERQSLQPAQLQPSSYPHLIATLMRTFRDKYADPYLALAMFDHARHLSIASYVFGCTHHAYNELIETRWRCFRDLRGVCDALEEMRVNGIELNNKTRSLAELVRREVGERNLWEEETSVGSGEVWEMVERIERLTATRSQRPDKQRKKLLPTAELWKQEALQESTGAKDMWEFSRWTEESSSQSMLSGVLP
ncbi:hypothetical protein BC835DRAFT_1339541 [Cytidiella melzeri]|nr:hypothetical protein BC835DRAFT_1339541 [Cytidiella melzeri]